MFFTILILSFLVFIKTIGYAIFEYKQNSNKPAAIIIAILAIATFIGPCVVTIL